MALVLACALASSVARAQHTGHDTPAQGFASFWSAFRDAALAGNTDTVASMAAFPFTTRGTLDSDPVKTYDRAAFIKIFDRLLDQDPGLSRAPDTMRHLIERTKTVNSKAFGDGGETARIGVFVFQKIGGQWRFTRAYVEE
jgi:hypothetical protein